MKTREELLEAAERVVYRLMNLEGADAAEDKVTSFADTRKGLIARDAGIREWDWPQGVGLYGLSCLQALYGDTRYDEFLLEWFHENMRIGLPSKNINTTAPFLALFDLTKRCPEPELLALCEDRAEWLMNGLPRTEDGAFQHVITAIGDRNGVLLHEGQVWADTLFMAVLFLGRMGVRLGRQDYIEESLYQFAIHLKYLQDPKTGLTHHGWTFADRSNFGGVFWCRGDSWITYGIPAFLEEMGETVPPHDKTFLLNAWRQQVKALAALQGEGGLWHTVLLDPTSYEETSGSAAIAAGIFSGIRQGFLPEEYRETALRAVDGICGQIAEDGTVQNVSAGTFVGMNADHYKNILRRPMAYGQSLTLLALTEAMKLF